VSRPDIPRLVRRELEERAKGRCEVCGVRFLSPAEREKAEALREQKMDATGSWKPWVKAARSFAHHVTSERRGKELVSDLLLVCSVCHRDLHSRFGTPPLPPHAKRAREAAGRRGRRGPTPPPG
jgi:hypothetical protein